MKRVFLTVLDAVGCGELPDAADYGDSGSNTWGHVVDAVHPHLPNFAKLGLGQISSTHYPPDMSAIGGYGKCAEVSAGKDTTTGHWEIAGLHLDKAFPTFPEGFPEDFLNAYEKAIGYKVIGNKPASGTAILDELGEESLKNKTPIVYTSADSVFQIACHEDVFPREMLYHFCTVAREMLQGELGVGRVIARPFIGEKGHFVRTSGRRDFSLPPIGPTLLDKVADSGMESLGVGKIEDIFDHRGLTGSNHAAGNTACIEAWKAYMDQPFDGLCFTNLVDTDMLWGHRRDPVGFANALIEIDNAIPEIQEKMGEQDLLIFTADHGCDPTFKGTDHTREYIPVLCWHKGMKKAVDLGVRRTYADIAATCSEWLGLPDRFEAESFYDAIR
ncbi:MAG: phosphopentomutase [Clostridiales bacterium]|nr:phosphopentomutase [Clostridiales bacterium]